MIRRDFFKKTAILSLGSIALPHLSFANGASKDKVKVALIGCGARGTGALINMSQSGYDIELVAMADMFQDQMDAAYTKLQTTLAKAKKEHFFNVKKEQCFVGINAYKELLTCDFDVVIDASPPAFRTIHAKAIVEAGKHAFLEKPACVDINQAREMYEISKLATQKGLCIGVGTQRRHHSNYIEAIKRVQDGQIGDIVSMQCYWNATNYVGAGQTAKYSKESYNLAYDDIDYQIRCWPAFIWTSGDHIVEQHVHNIDVCLWAFGSMPLEVNGMGSRSSALTFPKQGDRYTNFAVDYTMANGVHLASYCRQDPKSSALIMERVKGTKGTLETALDKITITGENEWQSKSPANQCLVQEHTDLLKAITSGNKNYNKIDKLVDSTVAAILGRMSAYSGRKFGYEAAKMSLEESLVPDLTKAKNPIKNIPCPSNYTLKQRKRS
ncbi:MAG: Gfo/Idh/MocA family oxidoreductase [Opitutales bacterium]